jgi:hypothetical protein
MPLNPSIYGGAFAGFGMPWVNHEKWGWQSPAPAAEPSPPLNLLGRSRYISPSGSDTTGAGSVGNPWLTLAKFYATSEAADTLYMRGGTYVGGTIANVIIETVGSERNPITVTAYPGETPVLDGSGPTVAFTCGFECATIGTDWSLYGSGTAARDTSIAGRSGLAAARIDVANSTATNYIVAWDAGGNADVAVAQLRFRLSALPTNDTSIICFNGRTYYNANITVASDGETWFSIGGTNSFGPTIVANQWYVFCFAVDGLNKVGHWSVDGVAYPDPGSPANPEQFNSLRIGKWNAVATGAFSVYVDDVVLSHTAADFPISQGTVTGGFGSYPSVVARSSGTVTGTAPDVTLGLGTVSAGDLLCVAFNAYAPVNNPTLPAGWTIRRQSGGTLFGCVIAYKIASGGETTTGTWTVPDGGTSAYRLWRIAAGTHGGLLGMAVQTSGTGSSVDLPSGSSGVGDPRAILWIASIENGGGLTPSSYPTSWTNTLTAGTAGPRVSVAEMQYTGTSIDPDAFVFGSSVEWSGEISQINPALTAEVWTPDPGTTLWYRRNAAWHVLDQVQFANWRVAGGAEVVWGADSGGTTHHCKMTRCRVTQKAGQTLNEHGSYMSNYSHHITIGGAPGMGNVFVATYWTLSDTTGAAVEMYHNPSETNGNVVSYNAIDGWTYGVQIADGGIKNITVEHNTIVNCYNKIVGTYHGAGITFRDNAGDGDQNYGIADPAGGATMSNNYTGQTITAAPDYGLTLGSPAIGGAHDGTDAGWATFQAPGAGPSWSYIGGGYYG